MSLCKAFIYSFSKHKSDTFIFKFMTSFEDGKNIDALKKKGSVYYFF